jgi:hypothetical protein
MGELGVYPDDRVHPPIISAPRGRLAQSARARARGAQAGAGVSTWPRTEWCPSRLRVTRPVSGQ